MRFSHKVFAMADAGRRSKADVLVWLDADILTHAPVRTQGFLGEWCRFYVTDAVFREREWHDCWLFDIVRRRCQRRGVRTFDIAGGRGRRAHDVFRESPAGRKRPAASIISRACLPR